MDFEPKTLNTSDWLTEIMSYQKKGWIFRGQADASWGLVTSLERCCDRLDISRESRDKFEEEISRDFRRAYHNYATHVPDPDCVLEWLSLMQHHGAPSRLLDFTYSIWVAAYFAVEHAKPESSSAIWAVDAKWAEDQSIEIMRDAGKPSPEKIHARLVEGDEKVFKNQLLTPPYQRAVSPLNPFRLNERLRIQKGLFLVPGDVTLSFADNLHSMQGYEGKVIKIVIPSDLRIELLGHLFEMNISRTSLFPGLDGYAQSLGIYYPNVHNSWKAQRQQAFGFQGATQ